MALSLSLLLGQTTCIFSDASGSWGCGTYCVVLGSSFSYCGLTIRCNNEAIIACLSSKSTRKPHLAHLTEAFILSQAHFSFEFETQYIAGKHNTAANALSHTCNKLMNLSLYALRLLVCQSILSKALTHPPVRQLKDLGICVLENLAKHLAKHTPPQHTPQPIIHLSPSYTTSSYTLAYWPQQQS